MVGERSNDNHMVIGREMENFTADMGGTSPAPRAAVLLPYEVRIDTIRELSEVKIITEASLRLNGDPRRLFIVCWDTGKVDIEGLTSAVQLESLWQLLDGVLHGQRADSGPYLWLLHDHSIQLKLSKAHALEGVKSEGSVFTRLLIWLRIKQAREGSGFLRELKETYGKATTYSFAWAKFYIQRLWVLAFLSAVVVACGLDQTKSRLGWELFKICVVAWGGWVAFGTKNEEEILENRNKHNVSSDLNLHHISSVTKRILYRKYEHMRRSGTYANRIKLMFIGLPVLLLVVLATIAILLSIVQLNAWLTYGWGDCVKLGCFDPEKKHGFVGWVAEVSSDVLLAVVFECLLALAKAVGEWVAALHNYQWQSDHDFTALMYSIGLEGIGKVGTYVIIAIAFVPAWTSYQESSDADCSDLFSSKLLGNTSLPCLQRRLHPDIRQFTFVRMMKGPFVVAPFISILVKTIIPWITNKLDLFSRRCDCPISCFDALCDALMRLLALIFTYDGDAVNGFGFVKAGWPFSDVTIVKSETTTDLDLQFDENPNQFVEEALNQASRKAFEPLDELLELKLSFLWVVFFAPLMPVGVIPTLGAHFLESHSDLTKLLYVRRRPHPDGAAVLHRTQRAFAWGTVALAAIWSVTLSVVVFA